ncbi:MAG: glycosyltransferase family 4 protein [Spirulina sp. SIO3F2]|nr:glycosyltransferase family 4 protein [Spirulina sp. SIO3F2]
MTQVLIIASHPVPYIVPLFRLMHQSGWQVQVAYCSLQGIEAYDDPEFNETIAWDLPLLEGYPWHHPPNRSPRPGLGRFWGLINPQLWSLVKQVDVVIVYTGYVYASFWIAALSAKLHGTGFIFSTDTSQFASRQRTSRFRQWLKHWLSPLIHQVGDVILVSSQFGVEVVASLGLPRERIELTPSAVDNDWWLQQSAQIDRAQVRQSWGIPLAATVVVFCAKLQPWKRPQDLLEAFAAANLPNSYLLFVGDGALRIPLTERATALGMGDRVRFLGFVNQRQLPAIYTAADLFCLCSDYEPFGVVVSEAMLCGCGTVVSDRVGARQIVNPGENGEVYSCGSIPTLQQVLQRLLTNRQHLEQMGEAARQRMETWSPQENVAAQERAIETALKRRRKTEFRKFG